MENPTQGGKVENQTWGNIGFRPGALWPFHLHVDFFG